MPILWFYADRQHAPAKAALTLRICDQHKAESTVNEFVSDEGWEKIADGFRKMNMVVPNRSLTTLSWAGPFEK